MFRSQPLRPKSYLSKNCFQGLAVATLFVTMPIVAHGSEIKNQASYEYDIVGTKNSVIRGLTSLINITGLNNDLVDPFGRIVGCNGQSLPSYFGYTVFLFNTRDRLNPESIVALDRTDALTGLAPNITNINPYPLNTSQDGKYNFLFNQSQIVVGKSYILVIKVPEGSTFGERRVLIDVTSSDGTKFGYTATSLDGKALSTTADSLLRRDPISINDAALTGLVKVGICETQPAKIVKTADRATAEPGDTVVYRITLTNNSDIDVPNPVIEDTLPLGMSLRPESVKASLSDGTASSVTVTRSGAKAIFKFSALGFSLPARKVVNLAYAVTLETDAVRGSGINSATLFKSTGESLDGPATHTLSIRQGLIRDTGTLIGRVFVDKNFDGEQQPNEPGIPNAVIFMDDGNRVTTDANGLFSVQAVVAGYRTGALDLTSLPGYTLAPNIHFKERNSPSRLVKLSPGGIVRMNFGVTPTAREVK